MVIGLFILLLVWLYGYWFGYMVTGLVIWFPGLVKWLQVWLYGYWLVYMVTGSVIWLLARLYGY